MQLTAVTAILLALSLNLAPSQSSTASPSKPAILGNLSQGKYSNPVLGIQFELPAGWQIDDPEGSEKFSKQLPSRMHLHFTSGDDQIFLSATPLEPDEKLGSVFGISLRGVSDAAGLHTAAKRTKDTWEGHEMLSQKVNRKVQTGTETGVYRGFALKGFYISILDLGPVSTETVREGIIKTLHTLPGDSN